MKLILFLLPAAAAQSFVCMSGNPRCGTCTNDMDSCQGDTTCEMSMYVLEGFDAGEDGCGHTARLRPRLHRSAGVADLAGPHFLQRYRSCVDVGARVRGGGGVAWSKPTPRVRVCARLRLGVHVVVGVGRPGWTQQRVLQECFPWK